MLDAIIKTLNIMGWLGIVLGILVVVNISCGTFTNIHNGEEFSWKKMFDGILKAIIFYVSAIATSIAFTMLPYINEMITEAFGKILISNEVLDTLSSVAVLSIVIATIAVQGKKALEGIIELAKLSSNNKEIEIEIPEDEDEENYDDEIIEFEENNEEE